MSNYFHDTDIEMTDAICGNCRFASECHIDGHVECNEHWHPDTRSKVILDGDTVNIYKLKTQYCSEHEFREDC